MNALLTAPEVLAANSVVGDPPADPPRFLLGPDSNGMSVTPAEFDAFEYEDCDPRFRYELIRGILVVSPIPNSIHEAIIDEVGRLVGNYRDEHPEGAACDGTLPSRYVATFTGRRLADRLIWCGLGRGVNEAEDVPTVAIEVVSERTRDRRRDYLEKRAEYRDAGVAEYWIVDRFARTVTVVEANGTERVVGASDELTSPRLPGFAVVPADLFREAERWGG